MPDPTRPDHSSGAQPREGAGATSEPGMLAGFVHRYAPGGPRTLLLLHGTGGDEDNLLPLGRALDPTAAIVSPRGQVLEHGLPRFFRRLAEGVFDLDDLRARAVGFADFVDAACAAYAIDRTALVAVGFSNGANIASAAMLVRPGVLRAAILLRPMRTLEPEPPPHLAGTRVWIGAGRTDPMVPLDHPERLAARFRAAGAEVTLRWDESGHGIGVAEVGAARDWLRGAGGSG